MKKGLQGMNIFIIKIQSKFIFINCTPLQLICIYIFYIICFLFFSYYVFHFLPIFFCFCRRKKAINNKAKNVYQEKMSYW